MPWPAWLVRMVPYLGRRRAGEDLEQEMRLHVELERDRLVDAGVAPDAAARAARRRLGNPALIREDTRAVWGGWLDGLVRDLRHVGRGLRRSPGFTAVLGQCREDAEHESTGRGRGVDLRSVASEHPQAHPAGRQVLHGVDQNGRGLGRGGRASRRRARRPSAGRADSCRDPAGRLRTPDARSW